MKSKKVFTILLGMIVCFAMLLGAASCSRDGAENQEKQEDLMETGYNIVENGISLYRIAIPQDAPAKISYAAKELNEFISAATGADLPIVTDQQAGDSETLISLGETTIARKLNVSVSAEDELGTSGYKIVTSGKAVCILSDPAGDGEGCIYGVYDFMEDALGFKVYAADEVYYETKSTIPLYAYDQVVKPSFDVRSIGYSILMSDQNYLRRMRLMDHYSDARWGTFGHSQVSAFLPTSVYGEHTDWYNGSKTQLCWSAGDAMETAVAENLIRMIQEKEDAVYFMLGQEDNQVYCNCEKCQANLEKYGSYSGLQVAFLNHVVEKAEDWRTKNAADREIRYVFFAYQGTLNAPIKGDGENITAYHEDCIPHEKLYVYYTPIYADFSHPLEDDINSQNYNALLNWSAIMPGRVMVYTYDINFYNFFVNFNNFNSFQAHLQTFYDQGVNYVYSQGPLWSVVPSFSELRIFVESQLMWDMEKSYDALVDEFMNAYYKQGAEAMRKYYDLVCNRYTDYSVSTGSDIGGIYDAIGTASIWTEPVVSLMAEYIDEAMDAIGSLRESDADLYQTLENRLQKERLNVLYLQLTHYQSYFSSAELEEMKSDFSYYTTLFGMDASRENGSLEGLFD